MASESGRELILVPRAGGDRVGKGIFSGGGGSVVVVEVVVVISQG